LSSPADWSLNFERTRHTAGWDTGAVRTGRHREHGDHDQRLPV